MKISYSCYFLFVCAIICGRTCGADSSEAQRIYKSIEEQLIEIRKEHPTTQQKIYTILDQVNRLSSLAGSSGSKIQHLEKELKTKESEFNILQDELIKAKKSAQDTEDKIKTLANNFEQEKKLAQQLAQEKKKTELLASQQKRNDAQERSLKNMFQLAHADEQAAQQTQPQEHLQDPQQTRQPEQQTQQQQTQDVGPDYGQKSTKNTAKNNQDLLRMLDDHKFQER